MNIYMLIIASVVLIIQNLVKYKKVLHMFQQNLYNTNNRYLKWLKANLAKTFLTKELLAFLLLVCACYTKGYFSLLFYVLSLLLYFVNCVTLVNLSKKEVVKKPLVITKRIIRLLITLLILYSIPLLLYLTNHLSSSIFIIIFALLTYFSYLLINVAKFINIPLEKLVYHHYEHQAKKKLAKLTNLKVIGITGSYGKTSSKNILNDILNIKYIAKPTPKNLNTEYGLMITINNYLDKFDEYLIAEMGAYTKGEIKTLCDMVHPKYGILTQIGLAHLESFGSVENIIKTKFELIESLPIDGIGVLNGDDKNQTSYKIKNKCQKIWIGIENKDVDYRATNIKCSFKGTTFDLVVKGEKEVYPFETKLLGAHNIYNILASIALGRALGMSLPELKSGVKKVKQIESRLELRNYGYMYQINDAYNSNPLGAKAALDVLKLMPGYKVVVTPGMTELGAKEDELNTVFGTQIAGAASLVILVGQEKTKPIYEGLKKAKYDLKQVQVVSSVYEAYHILENLQVKEDIYALFENDLPDIYNE